ncbi:lytic murein transglycosylase B [uncultured Nevskia sp.]|uniref:lytic murein transglycosylase B n=1 Tax=uncultured Nevskia sp. TaxID=228950 RepID=UPI0025EE4F14|nr:lytic murein transglycosylase B [uncultured Nevskia sp.]
MQTRLLPRALLGLLLATTANAPVIADYAHHPKTPLLLKTLHDDYGFSAEDLDVVKAALDDAKKLPKLIEKEVNNKEAGGPKPEDQPNYLPDWNAYQPIHVNARNIANGVRYLRDNAEWFARAEAEFGVPPTVVAAIMGVETKYGTYSGKYRVLDALATQGFDHPRRAPFFFSELTEFFAFARDASRKPTELLGSYAGAMGYAQFMPSNYRWLALDYDNDGKRDLWSAPDAIGSIAHYLTRYDPKRAWRRGEPLVVPATADSAPAEGFPRNGKFADQTIASLRAAGVQAAIALPDETPVGLVQLRRGQITEYWVALPNFYAIQTYNPRIFYAMAVTQLANALADAQAAEHAAR